MKLILTLFLVFLGSACVSICCGSVISYSTTNHPQTNLTCPEANYFSLDSQNQTICLPCDNRDNSGYGTYIDNVWNDEACTKVQVTEYDDYLFFFIPICVLIIAVAYVSLSTSYDGAGRMKFIYDFSSLVSFFLYIRWGTCVLTKPIAIASDYSAVMYQFSNVSIFVLVMIAISIQYFLVKRSLSDMVSINHKLNHVRKVIMIETALLLTFFMILISLARSQIPILNENGDEIDTVQLANKYRHPLTYISTLIISILRLIFLGFYVSRQPYEMDVAIPEPSSGAFIVSAPINLPQQSYQNTLVPVSSNGVQGAFTEETCVVCLHGKPDITFLPCRHQVVCSVNHCYQPLQSCPKCRASISSCLIISPLV
jgi:hypothetical protein